MFSVLYFESKTDHDARKMLRFLSISQHVLIKYSNPQGPSITVVALQVAQALFPSNSLYFTLHLTRLLDICIAPNQWNGAQIVQHYSVITKGDLSSRVPLRKSSVDHFNPNPFGAVPVSITHASDWKRNPDNHHPSGSLEFWYQMAYKRPVRG